MRVLVVGDLHGDASTAGLARFDDVARSLRACVELAKRERCDGFVQLGDLSDPGPRAHRCSALAIEAADLLARIGIWSRWLVGNHDVVEDGFGSSTLSPLAVAARTYPTQNAITGCTGAAPGGVVRRLVNVWSEPGTEWIAEGVLAVALPHPARGMSYEPDVFVREEIGRRAGFEGARIVLVFGHLTVEGIEPGSETRDMPRGREVRYPVEAIRETWGDRAVMINGHYHRSYRRAQSPVVVPGSLERLTRGEATNDPSVFVLEV